MNIETFQSLSAMEVAAIVHSNNVSVCSFTFNGTRRWFQLEYPAESQNPSAYISALTSRVIAIAEMLFDHGLDTLIMPVISEYVLDNRDDAYRTIAVPALQLLLTDEKFLNFYEDYQVDAYIYGNYEQGLPAEAAQQLSLQYQQFRQQQQPGRQRRIFWGICATDTATTLIKETASYVQQHGHPPAPADLVRQYYGTDVAYVDLHISSGKPQVFDIPLLLNGQESLYFMLTPSPYFTKSQLRAILFDHMYERASTNRYDHISVAQHHELGNFYHSNRDVVLGVGQYNESWGVWHPEDQPLIFPEPAVERTTTCPQLVLTG